MAEASKFYTVGDALPKTLSLRGIPELHADIALETTKPGRMILFAFWDSRNIDSFALLDVLSILVSHNDSWADKVYIAACEVELGGKDDDKILPSGHPARKGLPEVKGIIESNNWDSLRHFGVEDAAM